MICVLDIKPGNPGDETGEPVGWVIAANCDDAIKQALEAGRHDVAQLLFKFHIDNESGRRKYRLSPTLWVLVA